MHNTNKEVLLLSGSPKQVDSNSEALGSYLLDKLTDRGWNTSRIRLYQAARSQAHQAELLAALEKAGVIVLSTPLYVDSMPSAVIRNLEYINANKELIATKDSKGFLVIVNSGFPESSQNDTALDICRLFSQETGFAWLGGLPIGMGGIIDGKSLHTLGGVVKKIKMALDLTAEALDQGREIPTEAAALLRKPAIPIWMYRMGGNFGTRREAKKNGTLGRIKDRPDEF